MQNIIFKKVLLFSLMVSIFCFSIEKFAQATTISQVPNANFKFHLVAVDASTNKPITSSTKNVNYIIEFTNDSTITYTSVSIQPTINVQGCSIPMQGWPLQCQSSAWVPTGPSSTKLPAQTVSSVQPFSKYRVTVLSNTPVDQQLTVNNTGIVENATIIVNLTSSSFTGTVTFTAAAEDSIM